jgi:hypothetical protein
VTEQHVPAGLVLAVTVTRLFVVGLREQASVRWTGRVFIIRPVPAIEVLSSVESLARGSARRTKKSGRMEIKSTYIGTMIGLATVAFGLIAAGAWNKLISDTFALFLKPGSGLVAQLIYAVLVTVIAIVVVRSLGKLAEKEAEFTAKLPFSKKPESSSPD